MSGLLLSRDHVQFNCFGPGSSMALWNPWTMNLNAAAAQKLLSYNFINAASWLGVPPPGIKFGSALPKSSPKVPAAPEYPAFQDKASSNVASLRMADSSVAEPLVVYGKAARSSAKRIDIFPDPAVMDAHEP